MSKKKRNPRRTTRRKPVESRPCHGRKILVAALILGAALTTAVLLMNETEEPGPATSEATPAPTPRPWHYDAANDRHWYAPHGHWHDGPPPPLDER